MPSTEVIPRCGRNPGAPLAHFNLSESQMNTRDRSRQSRAGIAPIAQLRSATVRLVPNGSAAEPIRVPVPSTLDALLEISGAVPFSPPLSLARSLPRSLALTLSLSRSYSLALSL